MNFGDELPDQSNVLRSAKKWQILNNPPSQAFFLREKEIELSLQWLEYFSGVTHDERVKQACHELRLKPNPTWFMLTVSADQARANLSGNDDLNGVRFIYTPEEEADKSHSSVVGLDSLSEPIQLMAAIALARAVWDKAEWRELQRRGLAPK